ncbi:hypothetical protein EXIGLDRAFT_515509 [Exidia glandulosa HHB12029]|uniref:Uncharacterized protein n=1 Tax=Exidia glandulosa HHB12029 TaxID=1314781 RepID=A0A165J985_EXIGL|nr:hypothetical protein EXIGLDRAFT_515509 [Exidia glandulosa HHB12029]
MLEDLVIMLARPDSPDETPVQWPSDAFGGRTPPLERLQLWNVLLPQEGQLYFQKVVLLGLCYRVYMPIDMPNLFAWFPCLRRLNLGGRISFSLPVFQTDSAWRRIAVLGIDPQEPDPRYHLLTWNIPLAAIPYIAVDIMKADDRMVRKFYEDLDEILDLQIYGPTQLDFAATLTGLSSGRARRVAELIHLGEADERGWDGVRSPRHSFLSHAALGHRLASLTISAEMWNYLVGYMPTLERMSDLTLTVGPYVEFDLSTLREDRFLACPALRVLSIDNRGSRLLYVPVDTLGRFLDGNLTHSEGEVTVKILSSVEVRGSLDALPPRVKVEYGP